MSTLNLEIAAHVDAGKTTLTERLLFAAGVIDEIGRVDDGSTQTDTLTLERQRGITIKSAVVSFIIDDVTVPALTRGEGLVECEFDPYRAVRGKIPTRPRTDYNPLDRKEYLLHFMRRV